MESTTSNTSPLLHHAVRIRANNVELRNKIVQLQNEVKIIENNVLKLKETYDNLAEQCQILRHQQTDVKQNLLYEECQRQFDCYIEDIDHYLTNKTWTIPSMSSVTSVQCKLFSMFTVRFSNVFNVLHDT
jgi:uncharacterized coiled-coil DUF342 family protein